jgi:hypothetical protein
MSMKTVIAPQGERLVSEEPLVVHRRGRRRARVLGAATALVAVAGITAGILVTRPSSPQISTGQARPAAQVDQSNLGRVAVSGTGPGLSWVADRQTAWASTVVTGTGPALVHLANLQTARSRPGITGTGPGLVIAAEQGGAEDVAVIGTP